MTIDWDFTMVLFPAFIVKNSNALIDMRYDDVRTVRLRQETFCYISVKKACFEDFKLPITPLFMVRNIKCGYSFS